MSETLPHALDHNTIQALLYSWFMERGYYTKLEVRLASGKIADIVAHGPNGVVIVEVKPQFKHRLIEEAYGKYQHDCGALILAVGEYEMPALYKKSPITWGDERLTKVGIWLIRSDGLTVIRTPQALR